MKNLYMKQLPRVLEDEARKMCQDLANEVAEADSNPQSIIDLLDSPDRLARFTAHLFDMAVLSKIVATDIDEALFTVLIQLCRFVVARKHRLIRTPEEHHAQRNN